VIRYSYSNAGGGDKSHALLDASALLPRPVVDTSMDLRELLLNLQLTPLKLRHQAAVGKRSPHFFRDLALQTGVLSMKGADMRRFHAVTSLREITPVSPRWQDCTGVGWRPPRLNQSGRVVMLPYSPYLASQSASERRQCGFDRTPAVTIVSPQNRQEGPWPKEYRG